MRIPNLCLSVCPYPEKRNLNSFVNISPTVLIDTSVERTLPSTTAWKPENLNFFQKMSKMNFDLRRNHLSFVNVSPTLVIDTSMESSSRVLHHDKSKI